MDVRSFNSENKSVKNIEGELICAKPFPSMPLSFWEDKDDKKYFESYFNEFPDVWCALVRVASDVDLGARIWKT